LSGGQSCTLVACSVCHYMLAADEPSCSLLTACLSACCLPLGVRCAAVYMQRVIVMLAVRFVLIMLQSRRTVVCLSDSSPDVLPFALLAVPLLACSSLSFCLPLAPRQLIVRQSVPACDTCLDVQTFGTTLEADSKHARRSSLRRANSEHRER